MTGSNNVVDMVSFEMDSFNPPRNKKLSDSQMACLFEAMIITDTQDFDEFKLITGTVKGSEIKVINGINSTVII